MHHRSRHRKHDRVDDKHRFYLLPGQGGRSHRQKQWFILKWSLFAALVVAAILAAAMYWMNRPKLR
jgi:hypothetical protein